ncbi:MAG: hypothetical protein H8D74_00475 [Chloroflexi bacterium]|nr:hypothetical protein [Chloroflexota bacterium]
MDSKANRERTLNLIASFLLILADDRLTLSSRWWRQFEEGANVGEELVRTFVPVVAAFLEYDDLDRRGAASTERYEII